MILLGAILLELPVLGLWSFLFPCFRHVEAEEAVLDEPSGQSLAHLVSRPLEAVPLRDCRFIHVLAIVLMVASFFSSLIALWRAEEGVIEGKGFRDGTIHEFLIRLFNHGSGIFLVSFVFCWIVQRFHMLTLLGALSCYLLNGWLWYDLWKGTVVMHFFQSKVEIFNGSVPYFHMKYLECICIASIRSMNTPGWLNCFLCHLPLSTLFPFLHSTFL